MKYLKFFEGYKEDILSELSEIKARHTTEIVDLKNKIVDEFKHYLYDVSDNYEMELDLYGIGISNEELELSFTVILESNEFMNLMEDLEIASNRIKDDKDMKIYLNSAYSLGRVDYMILGSMLPVNEKGMKNIYDKIIYKNLKGSGKLKLGFIIK